ncbi:uncharacterized protein J3R85_010617 [Psidium guajava]|nr:uncharacterized protein J3R85_010617 [Psidium guajava]
MGQRCHYEAFESEGIQYALEDTVLVAPVKLCQNPNVAIIKDIARTSNGSIMVTLQWFYRPEEVEKKGSGSCQACDLRELFIVSVETRFGQSVCCTSAWYTLFRFTSSSLIEKRIRLHSAMIYDTVEKKLRKFTNKNYVGQKQLEIDILLQKTLQRLGDIPNFDTEDAHADQEDQLKRKRSFGRSNV